VNDIATAETPIRKQGSPLLYFLYFVMAIFIGILIFAYIVTKRTHPIFLDEHGKPTNAESAPKNSSQGR
jgi:hypothetical protein